MEDTSITLPDLKIVFTDVGSITFPNIKEVPITTLGSIYLRLGDILRGKPGIYTNKDGEIIGVRCD